MAWWGVGGQWLMDILNIPAMIGKIYIYMYIYGEIDWLWETGYISMNDYHADNGCTGEVW